jgi:hypothetical protein
MFTGLGLMYADVDISRVLQKKCVPELGRPWGRISALSGGSILALHWFDLRELRQITNVQESLAPVRAIDVGLNAGPQDTVVEDPRTQPSSFTN